MEFFGPWRVLEHPSAGTAELTIAFRRQGKPFEFLPDETDEERLRDQAVGREPPGVGPEDPEKASETTTELQVQVIEREFTFRVTARPWSGSGARPFACDFYPHPSSSEDTGVSAGRGPKGTLVFALAPDAALAADDYWQDMGPAHGRAWIHHETQLKLLVVRVYDARVLPDLGDPLLIEDLLPAERWNLHDALLHDIARLEAAGQATAPARALLSPIYKDHLFDVVNVVALPSGLWFQTASRRWSVRLQAKDPYRPSAMAWQLCSPAETGTWPPTLRLVVNDNVGIQVEVVHERLPVGGGLPLDPIVVSAYVADDVSRVPIQGAPLGGFPLEPRPPVVSFADPGDQLRYTVSSSVANALLESPGIAVLPLLVASPQLLAVGVLLGLGLSLAGLYYTLNERRYVLKYGVNFFGRPTSRDEMELALGMCIFGLVLDAAAVAGVAIRAGQQVATRLSRVDADLLRQVVEAAPRPIRLALRRLRPHVLAHLINTAEMKGSRALLSAYADVLHAQGAETPLLLLEVELQQVFTRDFLWFRPAAAELKVQYTRYVEQLERQFTKSSPKLFASRIWQSRIRKARVSQQRFAEGKLAPEDIERLTPEPLEWVTTTRQPAVKAIMEQLLGPEWIRKVQRFRPHVPLKADQVEMFEFLNQPLPYDLATKLRETPGKAYGRVFEFDHPFERRFVKDLAKRHGVTADEVMRYETAPVLVAPKNDKVARRLPGYTDYVHYAKTRRLEALIAFGRESEYTLQQIRDAHVFTIASYGNPKSPAIKMVDDVVAAIAKRTGQTVRVGHIPSAEQFASGTWKYYLPTKDYAMRRKTYLQQLDLLEEEIGRARPAAAARAEAR